MRRRREALSVSLLASRASNGSPLPLPALFSVGDDEDLQILHDKIYNLIALALRAYMLSWYAKLSPRDRTLLPVINRDVVVPLLSPLFALEKERITELLILHIPVLLATHVQTYWASRAALEPLQEAYHARIPSPTTAEIEGVYALNPTYLSALVDALLALHLPEKDYAADAERLVVREVVARAVLGSIGRRLSQPWFYAQIGLKFIPHEKKQSQDAGLAHRLSRIYANVVMILALLWGFITWLVTFLPTCPPAKYTRIADGPIVLLRALLGIDGRGGMVRAPIISRIAFAALEIIITLLSPVIDRVVPPLLEKALTPPTAIRVVDLLEKLLFPDGYPGPSPVDPTPEEAAELDSMLRARIAQFRVIDYMVVPADKTPVDACIDPFCDAGCNSHLVGMLLNAIVGTLVPRLLAEEQAKIDIRRQEEKSADEENVEALLLAASSSSLI